MRIIVDVNEPGFFVRELMERASRANIAVERSMLYKRRGEGHVVRARHSAYGEGCDAIIRDHRGCVLARIERKTLESLARSAIHDREADRARLFRQLHDLKADGWPMLIVEGGASHLYGSVEDSVIGLQLWCAQEGIHLVFTTGPRATAKAIVQLARRFRDHLETEQPHRAAGPAGPDAA